MILRYSRLLAFAVLCLGAVGCPSNNQVLLPPPGSTSVQRLFVGDDSLSGKVEIFTPPFTAASTPTSLTTYGANSGAALDAAGTLAVCSLSAVTVFAPGVTASSTPYATFPPPNNGTNNGCYGMLAFDSSGKLYGAERSSYINVWTPPFTSSSTPTATVATSGTNTTLAVAFDGSGNLYVSDASAAPHGAVLVYAPPYTGAPTATVTTGFTTFPRGIATNSTYLFAGDSNGSAIRVYSLPVSSSSSPAFSITTGINLPQGLAFDASGNLYVANLGAPNVLIYAPPFSAASTPIVTIPASTFFPFALALGR